MKVARLWLVTYRGGVMGKWLGPPHDKIKKCGAKTRPGRPCGQYAMNNGRCRFHGGKSTGAKQPHRPFKHGLYTKEAILECRTINLLLKDSMKRVKEILG